MGVSDRSTSVARVPPEGLAIIVTQTSNTEVFSAIVSIGKRVNEAAGLLSIQLTFLRWVSIITITILESNNSNCGSS